jgi:hypothetical protein
MYFHAPVVLMYRSSFAASFREGCVSVCNTETGSLFFVYETFPLL